MIQRIEAYTVILIVFLGLVCVHRFIPTTNTEPIREHHRQTEAIIAKYNEDSEKTYSVAQLNKAEIEEINKKVVLIHQILKEVKTQLELQ